MTSVAFRQAVLARESSAAILLLLTLDHETWAEPYRFVNRESDLISRGETYVGFHFELDLPDDEPGRVPRVTLSISNVDRRITDELRKLVTPFTALVEVIREEAPDDVERTIPVLVALTAPYDAMSVEVDLGFDNFLSEPFPKDSFTRDAYPGLF